MYKPLIVVLILASVFCMGVALIHYLTLDAIPDRSGQYEWWKDKSGKIFLWMCGAYGLTLFVLAQV